MNGVDKITGRIMEDAQAKADAIVAEARGQAAVILSDYQAQADKIKADALAQGQAEAKQRKERAEGAAQLEARKRLLEAKQGLLQDTFRAAVDALKNQPKEDYISFLADLMVAASATGREQVILNAADRAQVGKEAVTLANRRLAEKVAPKLPDAVTQNKLGAALDKVVTAASAVAQGTGMLTLSAQTRDIAGGCILADGLVEVNCALETLVEQQKETVSGEIAQLLFR